MISIAGAAACTTIMSTGRCCRRALSSIKSSGERVRSMAQLPLERSIKLQTNSNFANREDIRAALAMAGQDASAIINIEALLHKGGLFPSPHWLIELKAPQLAENLINIGKFKGPGGSMKVDRVTEADLRRMKLASEYGLDESAIRIQNVPAGMGVDEMAHFFRNFEVKCHGVKEIERIDDAKTKAAMNAGKVPAGSKGPPTSFVVQFTSADEAQRAIREKQHAMWGDNKIYITTYK